MSEFVWRTLASTLTTAALLVILGWLFRTWIAARLSRPIQREYDQKLELHKAALKQQNDAALEVIKGYGPQLLSMQTPAGGMFNAVQAAAQERRLKAIEVAWSAIVAARTETPAGLLVADAFPEENYNRLFRTPQLSGFFGTVDVEGLNRLSIAQSGDVEKWRPFMGEYIYSLYEAYRTLTLRVIVETWMGIRKGKVEPWYRNDVNDALVRRVLTADEMADYEQAETKLNYVRSAIENKVIAKAAQIISGDASAAHMLEQATHILDAVRQVDSATSRELRQAGVLR